MKINDFAWFLTAIRKRIRCTGSADHQCINLGVVYCGIRPIYGVKNSFHSRELSYNSVSL